MKNPVFIKIDEYKEILDIIDVFKSKLSDAKESLKNIEAIRSEEESELDKWNSNLEEVESKLSSINENLFNPEE